jgi:hypothetical protein
MKKWLKNLYFQLPIIRELRQIQQSLGVTSLALINSYIQSELAHSPKYKDTKKLNRYEGQVYSQNGEDGILSEIFRRIGTTDHYFVEFGVGNGLENNTAFLLCQGWKGSWMDGNVKMAREVRMHFRPFLEAGTLRFSNDLITVENIESLLRSHQVPPEFDLLSLDIDRNTFHVWKALHAFKPRVIVIEYNATFPPSVKWIAKYDASRSWNGTSYFGASLKAFQELGEEMGYVLVGCDFSGTNAFFVRQSEKLDLFAKPFTAENHYEPPRYWTARREAHGRCFDDSI